MTRPKPREYVVHELMEASNAFFVMASSRAEALEIVKSAPADTVECVPMDPQPTGKWWVEPRMRKRG